MAYKIKNLFFIFLISLSASALAAPSFVTYEGYIDANGNPVTTSVTMRFQIQSPTGCVLYQEVQTFTPSQGNFAVKVGMGTSVSGTFATAFSNSTPSYAGVGGTSCPYPPGPNDSRTLKVALYDGVSAYNQIASVDIGSAGVSLDSDKLEGKSSTQFIQTSTNTTQTKVDNLLAPSIYNNLINLDPTSTSGLVIPTGTSAQQPAASASNIGMIRFNSTSGKVEFSNGTAWAPVGASSGVASVAAGNASISIGGTASAPTVAVNFGTAAGQAAQGNDARIVGAIQNNGFTPSIQAGAEASKGAVGNTGKLYISTDGQRIYRDGVASWDIIGTRDYNDLINKPAASGYVPSQTGNAGKFLTTDGTNSSWSGVPWSSVTSAPNSLAGYGISDALKNFGNTPGVMADITANKPAPNSVTPGKVFIDKTILKIYRDNGVTWDLIGSLDYNDLINKPTADSLLPMQSGNAGKVLSTNGTTTSWIVAPTGESTTVTNIGTFGVGVYKQLTGTQIELKKINPISSAISITDNLTNNTIDIGVNAELQGLSGLSITGPVKRTGAGSYTAGPIGLASLDVSGTLGVANGGTGVATLTTGSLLIGNGTSAVTTLVAGATGNVIYASSPSAFTVGTPDTAGLVDKSTAQTINGNKTFNNQVSVGSSIDANSRLYVNDSKVSSAGVPLSSQGYGIYSNISSTLFNSVSTDMTAAVRSANSSAASSTGGYVVGTWSSSGDAANGTTEIIGSLNDAFFYGATTSTSRLIEAVKAQASNNGSNGAGIGGGTVTDLKGVVSVVGFGTDNLTGRIVTNAYGIDSKVTTTIGNTIGTAYGVQSLVTNNGTTTNAYGIYSQVTNAPTATLTNAYGVYVGSVQGSNSYGIYVNTSAPNYFSGRTSIGTTIPTANLTVSNNDPAYTSTALAAAITNTSTSLTTSTANNFPTNGGTVVIDTEQICYTAATSTSLSGLTRGCNGTLASSHTAATSIYWGGYTAFEAKGHISVTGNVPTVGCGTLSANSNDTRGSVTISGGATSSCVITFSKPYSSPPICVASSNAAVANTATVGVSAVTNANVTFAFPTNPGAFNYICLQ